MMHLKAFEGSVHLVAGGAYAAGLEVARKKYWGEHCKPDEALYYGTLELIRHYGEFDAPEGSPKTVNNMILALHEYFNHYGWDRDVIQPYLDESGQPAVEFSFALPIGVTHPQTGEDILYVGRYDMFGLYGGAMYVVDEKTTSQLGKRWRQQWNLRSQFTGYCWAAQQYGYPVVGAVIRGLSILKYEFGHEQVIAPRPAHMLNDWLVTTQRTIWRMKQCWLDMVEDEAKGRFRHCHSLGNNFFDFFRM